MTFTSDTAAAPESRACHSTRGVSPRPQSPRHRRQPERRAGASRASNFAKLGQELLCFAFLVLSCLALPCLVPASYKLRQRSIMSMPCCQTWQRERGRSSTLTRSRGLRLSWAGSLARSSFSKVRVSSIGQRKVAAT